MITRTDIKNTQKIVDYVIEAGLGGINWWSLSGDDYTGTTCKKGWFSMIRSINQMLTTTTGSSSNFCQNKVSKALLELRARKLFQFGFIVSKQE